MFFIFPLFVTFLTVAKANDWNTPCFYGKCEYTLPSSSGPASGVLKIWGSPNSISDITPAAGYEILDCSPDELSQDIRLVCVGNSSSMASCDHLFQNAGAEGKIVRLPENCGTSAFARVAKAWIPEDQSLPSSIAARLVGRDVQPQVKALTLDVNFNAIDTSKSGSVQFSIQGTSVPGANAILSRSVYNSRAINLSNNFNITNTTTLQPIDADAPFPLIDQSISCPPATASVKVNVDAKAHAQVSLGVAVSGTIAPPNFDQFNMLVGLTADLNGTVDLIADVSGTLDSGKIPIFTLGIPGLSFPGVLDIGPSLEIDVQAKATLDLNVDLSVGLNYHVNNAQLNFPPSNDTNTTQSQDSNFQIADTPLSISASPAVASTGSVEAHIIPTLKFGISALDKVVNTNVFLALDTSATVILTLEAQTSTSQLVKRADRAKLLDARANNQLPAPPVPTAAPLLRKDYMPSASGSSATTVTSIAINPTCTCVLSPQSSIVTAIQGTETGTATLATTSTSSTTTSSAVQSSSTSSSGSNNSNNIFGGCFEVKAGLDVTAGADSGFFGLFDGNTQVSLFSKSFELFKKCFGSQASRRSTRVSRLEQGSETLNRRAGLACPGTNIGAPVSVTSQQVSAANIKPIAA